LHQIKDKAEQYIQHVDQQVVVPTRTSHNLLSQFLMISMTFVKSISHTAAVNPGIVAVLGSIPTATQ